MSAWTARTIVCALLCMFGCSSDAAVESLDSGANAGWADDTEGAEALVRPGGDMSARSNAPFDVLMGTGRQRYMPLFDEDIMYLELGHQGLQHVLVSIRLMGLPQGRYVVDFQLVREDAGAVSEPARVRLPFTELSDGSGAELLGYTLVVADPVLGVGHDAVLRVAVEGPDGGIGMAERRVHVEWAPDGWNPDGYWNPDA